MDSFSIVKSETEIRLTLKPVMDLSVVTELQAVLVDCLSQGKIVRILAGEVERITTPCIQLLLAMENIMCRQEIEFSVAEKSEGFQMALDDIDLSELAENNGINHKPINPEQNA